MIEEVAEMLIKYKVKATWFATHRSKAVDELEREDLFEIGIHPNFYPNSTHGETEDEVLTYMKSLFPDAISMRTHGLYSNTRFLHKCAKLGIKIDVSVLIDRGKNLQVFKMFFEDGSFILRAPFLWEDDFEMNKPTPCWSVNKIILEINGLKIFDFHPVHICLNTPNMKVYSSLKGKINDKRSLLDTIIVNNQHGPRTAFEELIKSGVEFSLIKDLIRGV